MDAWERLQCQTYVAVDVGVEAAILLEDICYWAKHNESESLSQTYYDGRYWTVTQASAILDRLPIFGHGHAGELKVNRLLAKLETSGYILKRIGPDLNGNKIMRRTWLTPTDKALEHYTTVARQISNMRDANLKYERCKSQTPKSPPIYIKNIQGEEEQEYACARAREADQSPASISALPSPLREAMDDFALHYRQTTQGKELSNAKLRHILADLQREAGTSDPAMQAELLRACIARGWISIHANAAQAQQRQRQPETEFINDVLNFLK